VSAASDGYLVASRVKLSETTVCWFGFPADTLTLVGCQTDLGCRFWVHCDLVLGSNA